MKIAFNKKRSWLIALSVFPLFTFSKGIILEGDTYLSNPLFNTMLGLIIILLIILVVLSQTLKNLAQSDYLLKQKEKKEANNSNGPVKTAGIILLCLSALNSKAEVAVSSNDWTVGGLDMFTFYFMLSVIFLEIIFLILMLHTLHFLLRSDKPKLIAQPEKKTKSIIEILNASVEMESEEAILMDHEYDGIRELDNDLPPWWRYGFYLTVFVGIIYLIHFHVSKTGDLQIAEYNKEIEKGNLEVAEYMKKSANNVDETTIKMLGGSDLETGKENFVSTCAACHGKFGEGGVGPNLTDEYWMHGGSLADIFKSIKYGWPDKGMKSWKEDFSPVQMAQLTSYIRTLVGTNPPKPKAQQGDLYTEKTEALSDSLNKGKDSLQLKVVLDSISKKIPPEPNKK